MSLTYVKYVLPVHQLHQILSPGKKKKMIFFFKKKNNNKKS